MKYWGLAFVLLWITQVSIAQDKNAIKECVDLFYTAMEAKDTVVLERIMHPDCQVFSTLNKGGQSRVEMLRKASLLGFMKRAIDKNYIYKQKLWTYDIQIEANLATLRAEYTPFTGKVPKVSHCGVTLFTLFRKAPFNWVILNISDTRHRDNCLESATVKVQEQLVDSLLDDWHQAAELTSIDAYLALFSESALYCRADAGQRYDKKGLAKYLSLTFKQEENKQFQPLQRQIYFSPNARMLWFEEHLDTKEGPFRATGIMQVDAGKWKLEYYALSRLLPPSLVPKLTKLVEKSLQKSKN